jgi:hypothetical protein
MAALLTSRGHGRTRDVVTLPETESAATDAPANGLDSPVSPRSGWAYFIVGTALMAIAFGMLFVLSGKDVDWYVREDSLVEWTGAIGLFVGSALFLASFVVARRRGALEVGLTRLGVWMLLVMSFGLFAGFGEEISWGQRIFNYGEPGVANSVNAQGEMNLHNLNVFQGGTIDSDRLFRLGYFVLFVFIPLGVWASKRLRARLAPNFPIMPMWLAALFLMAWVLSEITNHVIGSSYPSSATFPLSHSLSEVLETSVETMTAIAGYLSLRRSRLFRASAR